MRSTGLTSISLSSLTPHCVVAHTHTHTQTNKETCENSPHTYSGSAFQFHRVWIPGAPLSLFTSFFCQAVE